MSSAQQSGPSKPGPGTSSSAAVVVVERDLTNATLGDFKVESLLGRGGMGEVYLARQVSLNRPVALKVLKPELAGNQTYLSRFSVEAMAVARLNHPNIVQVYTLGQQDGLHFIAMEFVQGTTLKDYITKKGTVDLRLALSIMKQATQAIAAAGDLGLIHRDIKPDNILLTKKGQAKVADFGLCREQGGEGLNLTQEGTTLGTPLYMSPEQVQGRTLDHRSDLYSLGVTFYHMLAGVVPFRGETAVAVALKHIQEKPVSLAVHRPDLPPELVALVMKLMEKKPELRYQTARDVLRDLSKIRDAVTQTTETQAPVEETVGLDAQAERTTVAQARVPFRLPRPRLDWKLVSALAVVATAAGAGWGWTKRAPDLLGPQAPQSSGQPGLWIEPEWTRISKQPNAAAQYRQAQLWLAPEQKAAGWLAVPGHFPNDAKWSAEAYAQVVRLWMREGDARRLTWLAESIEAISEPSDRLRRLARISRAASGVLADQVPEALEMLASPDLGLNNPATDAATLELALEVVRLARDAPSVAGRESSQLKNLRGMILESLGIEANELAGMARLQGERPDSARGPAVR